MSEAAAEQEESSEEEHEEDIDGEDEEDGGGEDEEDAVQAVVLHQVQVARADLQVLGPPCLRHVLQQAHGVRHRRCPAISQQGRHSLYVLSEGEVVSDAENGCVDLLLGGELVDAHGNFVLYHSGQDVTLKKELMKMIIYFNNINIS